MPRTRWCWHYACTKDLLDRFHAVVAADDPDEALFRQWNELEQRKGEVLKHAMLNEWRDVHRALTDDYNDTYLDLSTGKYPLRLCISGGEWLNPDWQGEDLVQLVKAEQIPDLCRALAAIDEEWFCGKLKAMDGEVTFSNDGDLTDELLAQAWEAFRSLRAFYLKAEKAGLPVVVVVEM
jgi:hypothetical protein